MQKKWKKISKNEKTKYTILPYNRRFLNDFLTKTKIRCFFLKIPYYIDHIFSKFTKIKNSNFLKLILVEFDEFLLDNKAQFESKKKKLYGKLNVFFE